MHITVIGWVIYGGRHCRKAKIFYLSLPVIELRLLDLQANTLPRHWKSLLLSQGSIHTGQCKRTGGCYNELVVAFFSTGGGVKGKKIYTC